MCDVVAAAALAAELRNHGFTMRVAVAFLAGGYQTVFRMAEGTRLVGVSGLALLQGVIDLGMTAAANFLRLSEAEGDIEGVMGVSVAAQAICILQLGPVAFLVMALETGRNLTMLVMTRGAGVRGKVFGVSLFQYLIDLFMACILVAGATVFLRCILSVADDHWLMRTGMTSHANLGLNPGHVVRLAAFLTVATEATRDKAVFGVAVGASHGGVLAGEIF